MKYAPFASVNVAQFGAEGFRRTQTSAIGAPLMRSVTVPPSDASLAAARPAARTLVASTSAAMARTRMVFVMISLSSRRGEAFVRHGAVSALAIELGHDSRHAATDAGDGHRVLGVVGERGDRARVDADAGARGDGQVLRG